MPGWLHVGRPASNRTSLSTFQPPHARRARILVHPSLLLTPFASLLCSPGSGPLLVATAVERNHLDGLFLALFATLSLGKEIVHLGAALTALASRSPGADAAGVDAQEVADKAQGLMEKHKIDMNRGIFQHVAAGVSAGRATAYRATVLKSPAGVLPAAPNTVSAGQVQAWTRAETARNAHKKSFILVHKHGRTAMYMADLVYERHVLSDAVLATVLEFRRTFGVGSALAQYEAHARDAFLALGGDPRRLQTFSRSVPAAGSGASVAKSAAIDEPRTFLEHLAAAAASPAPAASTAGFVSTSMLTVGSFCVMRDTSAAPYAVRLAVADLENFLQDSPMAATWSSRGGVAVNGAHVTLCSTIVIKTQSAINTNTDARAVYINEATGAVVAVTVGRALVPLDEVADLVLNALSLADDAFSAPGSRPFSELFASTAAGSDALCSGFPVLLSFGHLQALLLHLEGLDACMAIDAADVAVAGRLDGTIHAAWHTFAPTLRSLGTPLAHGTVFETKNADGSPFYGTNMFYESISVNDLSQHDIDILPRSKETAVVYEREHRIPLAQASAAAHRVRSPRCLILAPSTSQRSPCCAECRRLWHAARNNTSVRTSAPLHVPTLVTATSAAWTTPAGRTAVFSRPTRAARSPPGASAAESSSAASSRTPLAAMTRRELEATVRALRDALRALRERVASDAPERARLTAHLGDAGTCLELTPDDTDELDATLAGAPSSASRTVAQRLLPPEALTLWDAHARQHRLQQLSSRKERTDAARGNRWSPVMLQLALFWDSISPRLYNEIEPYFGLPSRRTLRRLSRAYTFKTGVHSSRFVLFKRQLEAAGEPAARHIVIMSADEIIIKQGLRFCAATGDFLGFADSVTGTHLAASISSAFARGASRLHGAGVAARAAPPSTPQKPSGARGRLVPKRGAAASPSGADDAETPAPDAEQLLAELLPARGVLQIIFTSVFCSITLPVAKIAVRTVRAGDFTFWLNKVLVASQQAGITIAVISTDGAGPFKRAQSVLLQPCPLMVPEEFARNNVALCNVFAGGLPTFWVPDPIHKMENMTGALFRAREPRLKVHGAPVSIHYLRKVFEHLSATGNLALARERHLTAQHLWPTSTQRMRPSFSLIVLRAYSDGMVPDSDASRGTIAYCTTVLQWYEAHSSSAHVTTTDTSADGSEPLARALRAVQQLSKWAAGADRAQNMPAVARELGLATAGVFGIVNVYVAPLRHGRQPAEIVSSQRERAAIAREQAAAAELRRAARPKGAPRGAAAATASASASSSAAPGTASAAAGARAALSTRWLQREGSDADVAYLVLRRVASQAAEIFFGRARARHAGGAPTIMQYASTESRLAAAAAGDGHRPRLAEGSNDDFATGRFATGGLVARVRDGSHVVTIGTHSVPLHDASGAGVVERHLASLQGNRSSPEQVRRRTRKLGRVVVEAATAARAALEEAGDGGRNVAKFTILREVRRALRGELSCLESECEHPGEISSRSLGYLFFPRSSFVHLVSTMFFCATDMLAVEKFGALAATETLAATVKNEIASCPALQSDWRSIVDTDAVRATGVNGRFLLGLFARAVDWIVNVVASNHIKHADAALISQAERAAGQAALRAGLASQTASGKAHARAVSAAAAAAGSPDASVIASSPGSDIVDAAVHELATDSDTESITADEPIPTEVEEAEDDAGAMDADAGGEDDEGSNAAAGAAGGAGRTRARSRSQSRRELMFL